ncbi:MAG: M23 family metallopeptidase [Chloroflexota bacterium]
MRKRKSVSLLSLLVLWLLVSLKPAQAVQTSPVQISIMPGDSWESLAWRFQLEKDPLIAQNSLVNPYLNPAMGSSITVSSNESERSGTAVFLQGESLLSTAIRHNLSPFEVAYANKLSNPYQPFYGTLFIPNQTGIPRVLPHGFEQLELSHIPAEPGIAIGWRGIANEETSVESRLNGRLITVAQNEKSIVGLTGTGAFQGSGAPLLEIIGTDGAYWTQPWRFEDPDLWSYQQITLTGTAAQIDQEAIQAEREWLFEQWEIVTPQPKWRTPFQTPVNSFLSISSPFGARRSYNGGPYRTYHEGVDYAAYGGTAVLSPASGTVIVAEFLYVRGGTVIIDHGLGIYSGYYHLSSVAVTPGILVEQGALLGEVGTTGLSTGNHLHWDLLVNAIWVDALSWQEDGMASWILEGWRGESVE